MNPPPGPTAPSVAGFRTRLLVAMMLVVTAITALALFLAMRGAARSAEREFLQEFRGALASSRNIQVIRRDMLVERCRALARKPRIQAALEDNAPDLLYPSARDGLYDLMLFDAGQNLDPATLALRASFYRFLDANGAVIRAEVGEAGRLSAAERKQAALPTLPATPQTGYIVRDGSNEADAVAEILTMPVVSLETEQVISAVILGFPHLELNASRREGGIRSGIWVNGALHMGGLSSDARQELARRLASASGTTDLDERNLEMNLDGAAHLVFFKLLNPDSAYPPALEVSVYPLTALAATQRQLLWQILGGAAALMLGGLAASHHLSRRLSLPVEQLAESRRALQQTLDDLRSTERELVQSEKMAALGTLTNGMMHEINNPLNFAGGALHILNLTADELPAEQREEVRDCVIDIKEGHDRISAIISDLRSFSRPDVVADASCPLAELVQGVLRLLATPLKDGEVKVEQTLAPGLLVRGDPNQLTLALLNIIKNAVDSHAEHRHPPDEPAMVAISARQDGQEVEIRISDNGPGIPAEHLGKVFDPFFTTRPPGMGTGMGLSAVYRVVNSHGGSVQARSEPGRGAEFVVRLPQARKTPARSSEPETALAT